MKKLMTASFILLTILLALTLGACSSVPTSTGTPASATPTEPAKTQDTAPAATPTATATTAAEAAPLTEKDLEMVFNGQTFKLKTDAKLLLDVLGKDYEKQESDSCLYEGMDREFDYAKITIITFPQNKKDIIDEVDIADTGFTTSRGIKVGATLDEVTAAYGKNYKDEGTQIKYILSGNPDDMKSPCIIFELENGKVTSIDYYSASNIIE